MGAWKLSTACLASRLRQSREDAPGRPGKTSLDIDDRYRPKTGRFELPVKRVLGNSRTYTRIPLQYRGVGKRACSASFREEVFSETQRHKKSRGLTALACFIKASSLSDEL